MGNTAVWVIVSYSAVNPDSSAMYWWFTGNAEKVAYKRMLSRYRKGLESGSPQIVRVLRVSIPATSDDDIDQFIDDNIDKLTDTTPARAQLAPIMTMNPDLFPTGGISYPGQDDDIYDAEDQNFDSGAPF